MTSKKYNVYIDLEADQRFAPHMEFLARVSETAATRLYDEYRSALEFIGDNAPSCPLFYSQKLTQAELRGRLFGKRYRIVFEIIGNDAFGYDIQDCRQDPNNNIV
ncbi:type II toxin-antitoxin system RelE/ParE family toxin [Lachnospiraceae bacterium ZAX-1]